MSLALWDYLGISTLSIQQDHRRTLRFIGSYEQLLAADANLELLDILGATLEKAYFNDLSTRNQGSTIVKYDQFRQVGIELENWARKYAILIQVADDDLTTCTK